MYCKIAPHWRKIHPVKCIYRGKNKLLLWFTKNFYQNKCNQSHRPWICAKPCQVLYIHLSRSSLRQFKESSENLRNLINLFGKEAKVLPGCALGTFGRVPATRSLPASLHAYQLLCRQVTELIIFLFSLFFFFLNNKWFLTNQNPLNWLTVRPMSQSQPQTHAWAFCNQLLTVC